MDIEKLVYNSITDNIAVIDECGQIIYVNKYWIEFGISNGVDKSHNWLNNNYFDACLPLPENSGPYAYISSLRDDMRDIFDGIKDKLYFEYPCHSPEEERWFLMRVDPFEASNQKMLLIRHADITERKLKEMEVESRNKSIMAALPDIMFLNDERGTYIDVYSSQPELLLHPRDKLIGSNIRDHLPVEVADFLMTKVEETVLRNELVEFRYDLDILGEIKTFDARMVLCENNIILTIVRDITNLVRAETKINELADLYKNVAEGQTELICRFSNRGSISYVNNAYLKYFELDEAEILGKNFFALVPGDQHDKIRSALQKCTQEHPSQKYRHKVFAPNGYIRWMEWIDTAFFDGNGDVVEYQGVGRDITEQIEASQKLAKEVNRRKKIQKDVEQKNQELNNINKTLELMLGHARKVEEDIIENFLANLRSPISMYIDLIKREPLSTRSKEYLSKIEDSLVGVRSRLAKDLNSSMLGLTQREIEIAYLVKEGKSTKEIMKTLNLSLATVETHRNRLRKKLGLVQKKINLRTYLNTQFTR